ncbi:MAG TPA: response regulator [Thermoanaerobaculia bacterium]|nr:response regulator [Thermoanaerobaculia bacterium]
MRRLRFFLLVVLAARAFALDPARPLDLYALDTWREGLPQYMVRTIVQTRDGYLWLGTMEGLVRFNGIDFEIFDNRNTPALTDQRIHTLFEDNSGTLWIGTFSGGVVRERNGVFEHLGRGDAISIMQSRDGSVWVGGTNAITRYRGTRVTRYPIEGDVNALVEGWVGTSKGLFRFDGARFIKTSGEQVVSLAIARDGALWVGTASDRILRNGETLHTGAGTGYINDLFEDSRGTMWIATAPTGLMRYRNGRFEQLDKSKGLPSNATHAIFEDREGSIWIGTDNGLARLKDLKFINYTTRQGLTDDAIRVVAEAPGGGLWIGTYGGGLNLLRDGKVTAFGEQQGLANLFIRTIAPEPNGDLWIGTDRGLGHLHDNHITMFPGGKIDALALLRDGTLLVGSPAGLQKKFEKFLDEQPRVIVERSDGSLWLGTYNGLALVRDGAVVKRWTTRDGLPGNMIFALREEPNGDLWIGTHDGLVRMHGGRFERITDGVVFQIIDDARGHFWLTSSRGMTRIDREPPHRAMAFGKNDGMGSDQCNGATQPAGIRMSDGRLAIPTASGLTIVDPADLHLNRVPPTVVLRELVVDGKRMAANATLPWSAKRYELRYDGLSLLMPQLVRFRYRIDGFDNDWIDAGTMRSAFYNSLPPGPHVFRVAAINNDGVWSGDATIAFTLPAPPWQRWWAIVAYVLFAIGLVWLFIRLRERHILRRTEQLERAVHERTLQLEQAEARAVEANRAKSVFLANMSHELRTPLNAVIGFAQLMARSRSMTDTDRENLSIIRRGGEHLLGLINDVLSISKIEAGKMHAERRPFDARELIAGVAEMIRARTEAAGLALIADVHRNFPPAVLGDEGKLRQVLINLLGNAVKFTETGTIAIRATWAGGRAKFEVSDTGHGIDEHELANLFQPFVQTATGRQAKEGTGLGLVITQQLVRLMGGDITVRSRRGEGTTFTFDIELPVATERVVKHEVKRVIGLAAGERRRIAVVDDTRDNRTLLRKLLESVGFEVRDAANGQDAIELWRAWQPHLIFMDQRMPVMDGSEATRIIRDEERSGRTPIIALTASAFEHERQAILDNGADEFVVKPFAEETIFDVIARHVGVRFIYEDERAEPTGNRVLLVDDDEITRLVAREVLTQLGLEVTEADNGRTALELLDGGVIPSREDVRGTPSGRSDSRASRRGDPSTSLGMTRALPFDAVLLDLEMPSFDGRATVREIRARESLRDLPVIAMTSHDRADAVLDGMTDYIAKPVNERQMAAVMGRYVKVAQYR